jgi:hypothetical protein
MMNPWRFETYQGKWRDSDPIWTQHYKDQVPYTQRDDGKFFMDIESFKNCFLYFLIQYHRHDYITSYYDKQNDDEGKLARYTFTTTLESQTLHVAGDTYDPRMYAFGCKTSKVMAQLLVRKHSPDPKVSHPTLGEKYFSDWIGFGHTMLTDLPADTYEIWIQYSWPEDTATKRNELKRDYTVRVYAQEAVEIRDSSGRTSVGDVGHDYEFWESVMRARASQSDATSTEDTTNEIQQQRQEE